MDAPVQLTRSYIHMFGSRNLVMSGDGSRLFWQGYIYDPDLNEIGNLGSEIFAATLHGELAFGATEVYNPPTGVSISTLPFTTTVSAISGDQAKAFLSDPITGSLTVVPMSQIAG